MGVTGNWQYPKEFIGAYVGIGFNDQARWRALAAIKKPAEFLVFMDGPFALTCGIRRGAYANACGAVCTESLRIPSNARHTGGENLIFADGHAKWYKAEDLWSHCSRFVGDAL
ncbi:MAG: hypothetical protein IT210_22715 [Armatimonadetes bacterium]|nr:hypothetical protein [Armatimonadota bacterium]